MLGISEAAMWPRAEHLQRVFRVRSGATSGTAITLDIDGRQYLASALHVVERAAETASLDIFFRNQWVSAPATVVGIDMQADLAVFALRQRLVGAGLDIDVNSTGCAAGQEVFFLGYPLGIRGHEVEPGFPLPVIKRGVVALFDPSPPRSILISASVNPGFSGGPVYFGHHTTGRATLIGILVHALGYCVPVKDAFGQQVGTVEIDSQLAKCSYIDHVQQLIRANPVGLPLA